MSRYLHIFVLSAFAFAQPLFDLMGGQPAFFAVRRSSVGEILLLVVMLLVILPLPLLTILTLMDLASRRWRVNPVWGQALHGLFMAGLAAAFFLLMLKQVGFDGLLWLLTGLVLGLGFALAYRHLDFLRQILSWLALSLVILPIVFLLRPGMVKLMMGRQETVALLPVEEARVPVIFVLADELSLTALLDAEERIDAASYPHLASFAAQATWFSHAETVSDATEIAVPALLTGRFPQPGQLPILEDHQQNLFTALGGAYEIWAHEPITQLVPPELNHLVDEDPPPWTERWRAFGEDLWVIYQHLLLPPAYAVHLPSVSDRWQGFHARPDRGDRQGAAKEDAGKRPNTDGTQVNVFKALRRDRAAQFRRFVDSFQENEDPTVHFLHILLPHTPWEYLPLGKRYWPQSNRIPGLDADSWMLADAQVIQAYQRYLLQLQFFDKLLGELFSRLEELELFDRALIIVAADHGVSFRPGDLRRMVSPTNLHDIAPVPLLIKAPHQESGVVVADPVSTLDILPTILSLLGIEAPSWPFDGRALLATEGAGVALRALPSAAHGKRRFWTKSHGVTEIDDQIHQDRKATLEWKLRLFGPDPAPEAILRAGTAPELVGLRISEVEQREQSDVVLQLNGELAFQQVDPASTWTPAFISGQLESSHGGEACCDLAVAVNGIIRATTRTFGAPPVDLQFTALVPDSAFREGDNQVEIWRIAQRGPEAILERLSARAPAVYALIKDERGAVKAIGQGDRTIPIRGAAVRGHFDVKHEDDKVTISGWAIDTVNAAAPQRILVFHRERLIYSGSTTKVHAQANRLVGLEKPVRSAFQLNLPAIWMPELKTSGVRLIALTAKGDAASELGFFYTLARDESGRIAKVVLTQGAELPVSDACVEGSIEQIRHEEDQVVIRGWAVYEPGPRELDQILIFDDRQAVALAQTRPRWPRPNRLGSKARDGLKAGFEAQLKVSSLKDHPVESLTVVGVLGSQACLLPSSDLGAASENSTDEAPRR